jgi:HSP20 family protein
MYSRNLRPTNALPDPGALLRDLERMIDAASRSTEREVWGAFPPLNVSRDEERCYVRALLPGIEPDKLQVSVDRTKVTIAGDRAALPEPAYTKRDGNEAGSASYHRRERAEGSFSRTLALDLGFEPQGVEASYRDGILTIALPLASSAKARLIPVQSD